MVRLNPKARGIVCAVKRDRSVDNFRANGRLDPYQQADDMRDDLHHLVMMGGFAVNQHANERLCIRRNQQVTTARGLRGVLAQPAAAELLVSVSAQPRPTIARTPR